MKAIANDVYGPADVLELRDVEKPAIGDDEVLVRVKAAAVDAGVWILMTGRPYLVRLMGFGLRRPKVAVRGRDLAGVVEAVGAKVTRFRPGDEVYGTCDTGSFAEYAAAPERLLARKPERLSFEQAAAVPVSAVTALQGLRDVGQVREGQRVMIIGASGGVGSFAVQIAKALGARVTAVCSGAKADAVRALGADDVIDYTAEEIDRDGPVYDVVLDLGGDRPLPLVRRALTRRGTLVLGGGGYKRFPVTGGFGRTIRTVLFTRFFVSQNLRGVTAKEDAAPLEDLTRLIDSGAVTPLVDRSYPLADASAALTRFAAGHTTGKIVLTV
ncbi:NAD(P)-dependent alcohol dehydrogenase [Sphaerisporangium rubeum]|uniref:NADPH:quinone reductase-like Zn-dependent oxidoreductase n=1 Tax=Sphaerisporangium rubeum TaxID=321317 RepID=A0A7X0M5F8_9ACTN|nr:NAD(P)-dependent alcohol dehydrogenase [Sphaerisporangium rubeum]MBB6472623.1 NADPH:quinone reductase-like Zn-dependent oxidoreductase [Sphaerisporangium rubeum]